MEHGCSSYGTEFLVCFANIFNISTVFHMYSCSQYKVKPSSVQLHDIMNIMQLHDITNFYSELTLLRIIKRLINRDVN